MTESELAQALKSMGMDASSYRALPLLPLVQVAWADGLVQDAERELILELAEGTYSLDEEGMRLLRNWLQFPPSLTYVEKGRDVLVALCHRQRGTHFDPTILGDAVGLAQQVAEAAGGFFGFRAVDVNESAAIGEIADALRIEPNTSWDLFGDDDTEDTDEAVNREQVEVDIHLDADLPSSAKIVIDMGKGDRACPVADGGVRIGRGRECDVQIRQDGEVSRQHCQIVVRDRKFYVEDSDSTSGTRVNGERILERRLLGGEEILVGCTMFRFELA